MLQTPRPVLAFTLALTLAFPMGGCSDDDGTPSAPDSQVGADGPVKSPDRGPDLKPDAAFTGDLKQLVAFMTGGFNSEAQSKTDPTYYDITLVMKRIWPTASTTAYWLYVEQAVTGSQPYRQRVYKVERTSSTAFTSRVFEFKNTSDMTAAVGAWKEQNPLSTLSESALDEKTGCAVVLTYDAGSQRYTGATLGKSCPSTLSGASYTTSKVAIYKNKLTSWDQGFNASDTQVWGAVKGPYVFDLIKDMDMDLDP